MRLLQICGNQLLFKEIWLVRMRPYRSSLASPYGVKKSSKNMNILDILVNYIKCPENPVKDGFQSCKKHPLENGSGERFQKLISDRLAGTVSSIRRSKWKWRAHGWWKWVVDIWWTNDGEETIKIRSAHLIIDLLDKTQRYGRSFIHFP